MKGIPNSKHLIVGFPDGLHRFIDVNLARQINGPIGHFRTCKSLAFSPNDLELWSGCEQGFLIKWDMTTGHQLVKLKGDDLAVGRVAMLKKDLLLATIGEKTAILVENGGSKLAIKRLKVPQSGYSVTGLDNSGRALIAGERSIFRLDVKTGTIEKTRFALGIIDCITRSTKQQLLAVAIDSGREVLVFDLDSNKATKRFVGHKDIVNDLAISKNEKRLASASRDGSIAIWDLNTGQKVIHDQDSYFLPLSISFLHNDSMYIVAEMDRVVFASVQNKRVQFAFGDMPYMLSSMTVSNDGSKVAVGHTNGLVTVWDIRPLLESMMKLGRK